LAGMLGFGLGNITLESMRFVLMRARLAGCPLVSGS
jgi:hypothetical protein